MKEINNFLQNTRFQYDKGILTENNLDADPLKQFELWMQEAISASVPEPNAMDLCTVRNNKPSSRIVLLKGVDSRGFTFFSNYESKKGKDIAQNPYVSLNFFWQLQSRQIRIEGEIEKVSAEESDAYFNSRPLDSKIGAWASPQSDMITSREKLEEQISYYQSKFADNKIPRPVHWGGFLIKPFKIEFWQGRPNRLHDRFEYYLEDQVWQIRRLAP